MKMLVAVLLAALCASAETRPLASQLVRGGQIRISWILPREATAIEATSQLASERWTDAAGNICFNDWVIEQQADRSLDLAYWENCIGSEEKDNLLQRSDEWAWWYANGAPRGRQP